MKRWILRVVVMLLTFAIGFGIDRMISPRGVPSPPPVPNQTVLIAPPPLPTVAAPVPPPPPLPKFILDFDEEVFLSNASFSPLGSTPKEFAEFGWIEAELLMPVNDGDSSVFIEVAVRSGEDYEYVPATVGFATKHRLFFATSKSEASGVEYWFDGEFLRTDFDVVAGKNKAVLRGTLTKTKHGRKIAQRTVSFSMEYIDC